MRIIKPQVIIEQEIDGEAIARKIERFTRKCYQSDGKAIPGGAQEFVKRIYQTRKHRGIAEHHTVSVTFVTDRGVGNELVRHRLASYLQESTRYCDYSGKGLTFMSPPWLDLETIGGGNYMTRSDFIADCRSLEGVYNVWRDRGWKAQEARYFLPLGLKTELACTMNLRTWRNWFELRTPSAAHPQLRQLAVPLLRYFRERMPYFYDDMGVSTLPYPEAELVENPDGKQVPVTVVYED